MKNELEDLPFWVKCWVVGILTCCFSTVAVVLWAIITLVNHIVH